MKSEKLIWIGEGAVASQTYLTSIHADPTGRYLYYVPVAHGGASKDGTPIVQYDLKTNTRKVLCFLPPHIQQKYQYTPDGCFCSVPDPKGETLYVSWDGWRADNRGAWNRVC